MYYGNYNQPRYNTNINQSQRFPLYKSVTNPAFNLNTSSIQLPRIDRSVNLYDSIDKNLNSRYKEASDNFSLAKSMIQTRLDKLNYEKSLIGSMKGSYAPYSNDFSSLYNMGALSNARGQLANPNLYSYQFMDPIYYPLEMPINGEPVALPRIEMGAPLNNNNGNGLGISDLLMLLTAVGKINTQPVQIQEAPRRISKTIRTPSVQTPAKTPSSSQNRVPVIPVKEKKEGVHREVQRDWWKLARDFVNLYNFFSTAKKYSKFAKVRNSIIAQRSKALIQEISVVKDWVIAIEEPFWNEFKVFQDLNVSFKNIDSEIKIKRESQKIIAMIKKYMENLIAKSSVLDDIPERIKSMLYEYCKDKAYFHKKYLSTFQINRLDFNFNGGLKSISDSQAGMLIAFLIINGVSVQQLLLHMKDTFVEFKNYPNIEISGKYIGSIMHYLTRDAFQNEPSTMKEVLALMNYYRNYHIFNEQVEKQENIFNNNIVFIDVDEFAEFLVPENQISEFWKMNSSFIETYKRFILDWSSKLARKIRLKYSKNDPNLAPKRRLERPKDKTLEYDVKIGNRAV